MAGHDDDIALFPVDLLKEVRRDIAGPRYQDAFKRDACFLRSPSRSLQKSRIVTPRFVVYGAKDELGIEGACEIDRIPYSHRREIIVDDGHQHAPVDLT